MGKTEDYIKLVEESIEKAKKLESNINEDLFKIKGMSTPESRCLLNNICGHKDVKTYLEIGAWCGSTATAAVCNNKQLTSYIVENFSESFYQVSTENTAQILESNLKSVSEFTKDITLINSDCFKLNLDDIKESVDVYWYDGEHSKESQKQALLHYFDKMSNTFIFMVDDYNDDHIQEGTQESLEILKDKCTVEKDWELLTAGNGSPVWWNGLYISVITKKVIK